jgi:hypothetical protein
MVPFSFSQALLISRGMEKHSSTIEVWTLGARHLEWGAFALSCLPAFLILIPVFVFGPRSVPPRYAGFNSANSVILSKTQKRLNEPNSKNAYPSVNIGYFSIFAFF